LAGAEPVVPVVEPPLVVVELVVVVVLELVVPVEPLDELLLALVPVEPLEPEEELAVVLVDPDPLDPLDDVAVELLLELLLLVEEVVVEPAPLDPDPLEVAVLLVVAPVGPPLEVVVLDDELLLPSVTVLPPQAVSTRARKMAERTLRMGYPLFGRPYNADCRKNVKRAC
jgi:hypothetical protein